MSVALEVDRPEQLPGLFQDGRPDPRYPASLGILPARLRQRSWAFAIDAAVFVVLSLPIVFGALPRWSSLESGALAEPFQDPQFLSGMIFFAVGQGLLIVYAVVQLLLHGLKGRTIGRAIMGIRSVNAKTFARPGFWRIALRAAVFALCAVVVPVLGAVPVLLSPLWDIEKRGRGWLDHIAGNWLIDVRRGLDPFDAPALRRARKAATSTDGPASPHVLSLATGASSLSHVTLGARSRSGVVGASAREAFDASPAPDPGRRDLPPKSAIPVITPPPPTRVPASDRIPALLRADDGARYEIEGVALVGRDPIGSGDEMDVPVVSIRDDSLSISKTHARIEVTEDGIVVEDRHSSNGTTVLGSDGDSLAVEPSARAHAAWGWSIKLGDRVFEVTRRHSGTDTE